MRGTDHATRRRQRRGQPRRPPTPLPSDEVVGCQAPAPAPRVSRQPLQIDGDLAHGLIALRRILLQSFLDRESQADWDLVGQRSRRKVDDLLKYFQAGLSLERLMSREQLVQHNAEGEHVAPGINRFATCLLGDMYGIVPATIPGCVWLPVTARDKLTSCSSASLASPKSPSLA